MDHICSHHAQALKSILTEFHRPLATTNTKKPPQMTNNNKVFIHFHGDIAFQGRVFV